MYIYIYRERERFIVCMYIKIVQLYTTQLNTTTIEKQPVSKRPHEPDQKGNNGMEWRFFIASLLRCPMDLTMTRVRAIGSLPWKLAYTPAVSVRWGFSPTDRSEMSWARVVFWAPTKTIAAGWKIELDECVDVFFLIRIFGTHQTDFFQVPAVFCCCFRGDVGIVGRWS